MSDVSFALDMNGSFEGTAGGEESHGDVQMNGDATRTGFAGSVVISQPGLTISADTVVIGEQAWVRPTGGDWQETFADPTQPIQPIIDLTAEDLTYVELTFVDGAPQHRLTIDRWTGGDPRSLGLRRPKLTITTFEVLVDNQGHPVSVELSYRLRGRLIGLPFDVMYDLHYLMGDFGKPVTIEAPI